MYSLIEFDTIKSVLQNIQVILTTIKGSDPHRPEFGLDIAAFQDKPLTALDKGKVKAEVVEAIETWEPRAKVSQIDITYTKNGLLARLTIDIEGAKIKQDVRIY